MQVKEYTHTRASTLSEKKGKLTQDILIIWILIHFFCFTAIQSEEQYAHFIFLQYSIPAVFFFLGHT